MSQDIRDFVTPSCQLLALGEAGHWEPAFALLRNEMFSQLVDRGFRSIALETDRVAALKVNDFVQHGAGSLDQAMSEGFSHNFGAFDTNRQLIAWMREYNQDRPSDEQLTFHGFDTQTENTSAPSPRSYLEYARDYLGLDLDLASLAGEDERWHRTEAILDAAMSIGATAEAEKLRLVAEDMLTSLDSRAPDLIAATSTDKWLRARTHLTAGLGLLRYHKQAAVRAEQGARISRLLAVRDALMAQNLLEIRRIEAQRGPTVVGAHNVHLQTYPSAMGVGEWDTMWISAGAIVGALLGDQYTFVASSLGRSATLGLGDPDPDTYEGILQNRTSTWELSADTTITSARTRTDTTPQQGYLPLTHATLDAADVILHISDSSTITGRP
jgi:erythromycin esterase-like protein